MQNHYEDALNGLAAAAIKKHIPFFIGINAGMAYDKIPVRWFVVVEGSAYYGENFIDALRKATAVIEGLSLPDLKE